MAVVKNQVFHTRIKHIELQYHFVHKLIMDGDVETVYGPTIENGMEMFMKSLGRDLLSNIFIDSIGLEGSGGHWGGVLDIDSHATWVPTKDPYF